MKTFIYTARYTNASYCKNCTIEVYRVKHNRPIHIGTGKFNTGGSKGAESEAYKIIVDAGHLSKKAFKNAGGYYRLDTKANNFAIWGV